jgi:predicted DNA-binding transcriptional regulator AlpA
VNHNGGRPTKFSADLAIKFGLLQVSQGLSMREAMARCSISRWSVWRWGKRYSWFGVFLNTIRETRKRYPMWFCDGVLPHRKRRLFGTRSWAVKVGRPTKYQPCFAQRVRPSVRQTAASLGVPRSTIHRWAKQHYLDFGVPLHLARAKEDIKKIERAAGFR